MSLWTKKEKLHKTIQHATPDRDPASVKISVRVIKFCEPLHVRLHQIKPKICLRYPKMTVTEMLPSNGHRFSVSLNIRDIQILVTVMPPVQPTPKHVSRASTIQRKLNASHKPQTETHLQNLCSVPPKLAHGMVFH